MKLTGKCDVEAPIGFAYASITDFPAWERSAVRRGAAVDHVAGLPVDGVGAGWRIKFPYRNKQRKATITVSELSANERAVFSLDSPSLEGESVMDVLALSPKRTRIRVQITVKPRTIAARLFLNALRLGRKRILRGLDMRMGQLGAEVETQFAQSEAQKATLAKA